MDKEKQLRRLAAAAEPRKQNSGTLGRNTSPILPPMPPSAAPKQPMVAPRQPISPPPMQSAPQHAASPFDDGQPRAPASPSAYVQNSPSHPSSTMGYERPTAPTQPMRAPGSTEGASALQSTLLDEYSHSHSDGYGSAAGDLGLGRDTSSTPLMKFKATSEHEVKSDPNAAKTKKQDRPEAFVIACDGNMAVVQGDTKCVDTISGLTWAVGRMLSIIVGKSRIVGMLCDINMPEGHYKKDEKSILHFKLELQGEISDDPATGKPKFVKGISTYPGVGSVVHQIRAADLASIYAANGENNGVIGSLSQDKSIPALVNVNDMLSKHFAVLGSTGCGKSASVSLLLHCAQELVPDLRTIILDPHNEYTRAFPEANTISQANLDLPFWMFHLEEYVEVLFRGKPLVHEEVDALREFIPYAKTKFRDGDDRVMLRPSSRSKALTADSPAPYRIADLLLYIDEEMGLLESQYEKTVLRSLKARIVAHSNDARYAFMFRHKTIEDIAPKIIGHFFGLPGTGALTTIIQMAGMPAEVVNSVASVLCRLSFELAIAAKGNLKILVVCEEAHRYVPVAQNGFEPTRRAIARIAKEGRKYGSFMAIVSQRPSELDPTILSQCSTVFSLRLTNDYDQEIISKAISSSSASTISFISSLSNRECIAFGEGMNTPMRLKFRDLPQAWLPGAEADVFGNSTPVQDAAQSNQVISAWRRGSA